MVVIFSLYKVTCFSRKRDKKDYTEVHREGTEKAQRKRIYACLCDAKYRTFRFNDMDGMTDNDLHRLGKRVARVGTAQMADLAGGGLTTAKITAMNLINTHFVSAMDDMDDSEEIRDIATQNRVDKGNEAYSELVQFCNTGKDIYESSDEAKYNDYVIYNTPDGTPPPPAPPV